MTGDDGWLVVGLGNPGASYAANRHNAGALVADVLAGRMGGRFGRHKARAAVVEGRLAGIRVVLAKPSAYVNESGGPVVALRTFYKVPPERLVLIHDELDLPYGTVRCKRGGGDNGHNGLRSVTRALGTRDYLRVRFGIGRPPGRLDPADFVLRDFTGAERADLPVLLEHAADAVESVVTDGLDAAQNRYNGTAAG